MPPKSAKVVPEVAPVVKEAKHKTKAAAKSETADKKQDKPAPKGKKLNNNLQKEDVVMNSLTLTKLLILEPVSL